jgi:flagellar biosynthesis/type III secretory pathway protein FliH
MAANDGVAKKWWQEFLIKVTVAIAVAILTLIVTWVLGKKTGYDAGYDEGKGLGEKVGRDKGYAQGLEEGKDRKKWYEEGKQSGDKAGYAKGHEVGAKEGEEKGKKAGYDDGYEKGLKVGQKFGLPKFLENYERHLAGMQNAVSIYKDNKDQKQLLQSVNNFVEAMKVWRRVIQKLETFKNGPLTELEAELQKPEPDYDKIQRLIETLQNTFKDKKDAVYEELKQTVGD